MLKAEGYTKDKEMQKIKKCSSCKSHCGAHTILLYSTLLYSIKGRFCPSLRYCSVKYKFTFLATTRFINLKFGSYVVGVLLSAEFFFGNVLANVFFKFLFLTLSFSVFYNWWGFLLLRNPIK